MAWDDPLGDIMRAADAARNQPHLDPSKQPIYLDRAGHGVSLAMSRHLGKTVEELWAPHPVVLAYGEHIDDDGNFR